MEFFTFILRHIPHMVKTTFSRHQTENDEDNQIGGGDASPLFPKIGYPIKSIKKIKVKTFNMEQQELFKEHRYALFNI